MVDSNPFPVGIEAEASSPRKLAVFIPNWVGDACMATPALRALRQRFPPTTDITLVGRRAPLEVLDGLPFFDRTIVYKPRLSQTQPSDCVKDTIPTNRRGLIKKLRREKFDLALLLTNSLSTGIIAWLGRCKSRVGYASDARGWLIDCAVPVPRDGRKKRVVPAIDSYLALTAKLGCDSSDRRMTLHVSEQDEREWCSAVKAFGWSTSNSLITLNSGGAFGQSKVYPRSQLAALCKQLLRQTDSNILIHCGPAEREDANELAASIGSQRLKSLGERRDLPLGLTRAALKHSDVVVSTDSGPRHIAVALDRSVVSLFGPTIPDWTTTYNQPETQLSIDLDCRPCYGRQCPLKHHHCMQHLSPIEIQRAVCELLDASKADSAAA